ncbi:MAG: hypothetical protein ACODAF_07055 [Actinomycetota bacterium]
MAFVHGKGTVVTLDDNDLSAYTNTSEISREVDSHDVTAYGKDAHDYEGGLTDGTITLSGTYDDDETDGPRAVIDPLLGTKVTFVRQPEGEGSGKAQDSATVLVTSYTETAPVADMVTWSCELQISGDVDTTAQT